jgi:hypothetical protein
MLVLLTSSGDKLLYWQIYDFWFNGNGLDRTRDLLNTRIELGRPGDIIMSVLS